MDFVVVVMKGVESEKRERLEKDGAMVVEVDDVVLPWWIRTGVTKVCLLFAHLRFKQW